MSKGKSEVDIASIEQLDSANDGHMIVVEADITSLTNENRLNLNIVYQRLLSKISSDTAKEYLCSMLMRYGYFPRPEYENGEYTYEIKGVQHYYVDKSFPCLRRTALPCSVKRATYELSLTAIQDYRED